MRKTLAILVLLAVVVPFAGSAGTRTGEGTLSVDSGRGKVTVQAKGAILGRIANGSVVVYDLTPNDAFEPYVSGDEYVKLVGETGIQYGGRNLRFRLIGGSYRVVVKGAGIDLSVVANGVAILEGDTAAPGGPGVYSIDGTDCRTNAGTACKPLPDRAKMVKLGSGG
ncbi:MAG: hypothetical protein H0W14_00805 [Actinobacteria bacterium]|nr:hypothetical protein [Actinomycetota bacterium]